MSVVVLGLGGNCGDRLSFLRKAVQQLKSNRTSPEIEVVAISPIYESNALLPEGAPEDWNQPYFNLNILCHTDLPPPILQDHLKKMEGRIGHKAEARWAPREIDIDILSIDSLVYESSQLKVPHIGLLKRPFALLPFADLLPQWKCPLPGPEFGMSCGELAAPWRRKPPHQIPFFTRRSTALLTEQVGILNLTPDSFSDGGRFVRSDAALEHAGHLVASGARILDMGAESTRPGAPPISVEEEWKRLEPVLSAFHSKAKPWMNGVRVSVDTRHAETARRAIQAGAQWINDVTGFQNPEMRRVVAGSSVDLVLMHSLGVPPSQHQVLSLDEDPVSAVLAWGEERIQELEALGVSRERVIFDPGLGFGKTIEQNWELLRGVRHFQKLGVRILVGHSRKSFLKSLTDGAAAERDLESTALSLELTQMGVDFIRLHNMEMASRCLNAWTQANGIIRCQPS